MKRNKQNQQQAQAFPPVKVAVLIDGGFFIKRYKNLNKGKNSITPEDLVGKMYGIAHKHVGKTNTLYRIFYYDCVPFEKKMHNPISGKSIDFKKEPMYDFRMRIFEGLKRKRKVALRLGTLNDNKGEWIIRPAQTRNLLSRKISINDLTESDVYLNLRQKGIDMKIGVDIATLALKRFVDKIVLISGDADFVPAAKLARREGIDFILDPMGAEIAPSLFEHIDGLETFIRRPQKKRKNS